MNPLVQEFFRKNEEECKKLQASERNKVLIDNGLYTEERTYSNRREWGMAFYDKEKKQYYAVKKNPVEVTDEEYARILSIVNEKKSREDLKSKKNTKTIRLEPVYPQAERILNFVIKIELGISILLALLFLVASFILKESWPFYVSIPLALLVLIAAILTWASIMVIINISNNLHNISRLNNNNEEQ